MLRIDVCQPLAGGFWCSFFLQGMHKFSIVHYAGTACYDTKGFCDKNKDAISTEAATLIASTTDSVLSAFFKLAGADVCRIWTIQKQV